jgi:hypothetical protein
MLATHPSRVVAVGDAVDRREVAVAVVGAEARRADAARRLG